MDKNLKGGAEHPPQGRIGLRVIFQLIPEVNFKKIVFFVSWLICFFCTEKSLKYSDDVS